MKRELLYRFCHGAAGCVLMYHAIQVIESRQFFNAALYLSTGLLFLVFAGIHEWIEKKWSRADLLMFALEASALLYVASRYYKHNNKLAIGFAAAGVFFVLLMISSFAKKRRRHKRHHRKHRHKAENPNPHRGYKMMKDTDDI